MPTTTEAIAKKKKRRSYCRFYDKAIELNPKDADAYNNRGAAKMKLKQYKEAIADYDKAIELKKMLKAYNNRGFAYRELGKKEEALQILQTWAKPKREH